MTETDHSLPYHLHVNSWRTTKVKLKLFLELKAEWRHIESQNCLYLLWNIFSNIKVSDVTKGSRLQFGNPDVTIGFIVTKYARTHANFQIKAIISLCLSQKAYPCEFFDQNNQFFVFYCVLGGILGNKYTK